MYILGLALAFLFWVSVDFPELFLKTLELFLKLLGPIKKAKSYSKKYWEILRAILRNIGKSLELFLKVLGIPQSYF